MMYVIQNEFLKVSLDSFGAEMKSIISADGVEYLWQGDPAYWTGQALNIFPFVGRLTEGKYTFEGKTYDMTNHGFAKRSEFQVTEATENKIVFTMEASKETLAEYPFEFLFSIIYELDGNKIVTEYKVVNKQDANIYFAVGGHPGFNVPMGEEGCFEEYYLEFAQKKEPKRVEFSPTCFVTGNQPTFDLIDGVKVPLVHNMFDKDAVVFVDMCREITLKSDKTSRSVQVGYPDMKYLGIWHMPETDAPYVCIEPWSTLPARQDVIEDIEKQPDMVVLEGKGTYRNKWWIAIN